MTSAVADEGDDAGVGAAALARMLATFDLSCEENATVVVELVNLLFIMNR